MDDRLLSKFTCVLFVAIVAPGCAGTAWKFVRGGSIPPSDTPAVQLAQTGESPSAKTEAEPQVAQASHTETAEPQPVAHQVQSVEAIEAPGANNLAGDTYPIDLANALQLGGASNLEVRIARSQIAEAQARYLAARSLWLPSLRFGVGWNKHDGRLQETEGNVIEVSRNSLFYGGGAGLGDAPLAGGASGPFRLAVNLSLADAAFTPLVQRQLVSAAGAGSTAALNDNLLAIASAYFGLVEAYGRLANQREALGGAESMVEQVSAFEKAGYSSQTELERVGVELARRRRLLLEAERRVVTASAELARLLRLPPQVKLEPAEEYVLPVAFFDAMQPVEGLIAQSQVNRPEVSEANARLQAACWRTKQETWRPWLPNVQAGASAGSFGGGTGSDYENDGGRSDVDLLAVWELQNVGVGNIALRREAASQYHQQELALQAVRDQVAAETVAAHADVASYAQQLVIAEDAIRAAEASYRLNASRIQDGEGLPIELIQSLNALAQAQEEYTVAVANHNLAQYRLMRAVGIAPAVQ